MEVFRNDEAIGYSNYFFEHKDDSMTIKNYTQFKVKLLGITIFSILSEAIKKSFSLNVKKVWVHTCSLDHKNALKNYLSRGMKIYNTETANIKSA